MELLVDLPCFAAATYQELLDYNRPKAQLVREKWTVKNPLSEQQPTAYQRFGLLSACTQHGIKRVLWVTEGVFGTRPWCWLGLTTGQNDPQRADHFK